ncbi:MAG: ATP-binding cassette domain-containing protein [Desulfobacterales bacterium]|jgi:ATP-binding cassette subfamily F protein uup
MALIGMRNVSWGFGGPPLLENISIQIEKGERVCLIGRNGVGKSTMLKLFSGSLLPDKGSVWHQQGITVAALIQDVPAGLKGTIFEIVAEGLGEMGKALAEQNRVSRHSRVNITADHSSTSDDLQHKLDSGGGWLLLNQIDNILSRTRLNPDDTFADLSAGMKRRVLFARALVRNPDVLLLDEPTNHLDINTIIWMEEFIQRYVKTLVFVTHDRDFLKKIANRIVELDRARLVSYDCNYPTYLRRRRATLDVEEKQNNVFDKKLSLEEAWIRKGIRARRTRNEGRVRNLEKMRAAYRDRRKTIGDVRLQVQEAEQTGKLVIEAKAVSFSYHQIPVVRDLSTVIMRGDKVGVIGPNGVGKTTLLKVLLKKIKPESGSVRHGTHLQAVYFDQLRAQLDDQKTVQENISEGNDFIIFNGRKRHVISHLQDFLFTPERCRTPVYVLSGGEKNRLMLAKLFARPANVLVLDEPTNDLDAETLELLEELLLEFRGTFLLVSHDRAFLNNVVTSTLVFEGDGRVIEYAGGYDDWLEQRPNKTRESIHLKRDKKKVQPKPKKPKPTKLGYMQKRELNELPQKIDALELKQKDLYTIMSDPRFYKKDKAEIARLKADLDRVEKEIETAYFRWEELENVGEGG